MQNVNQTSTKKDTTLKRKLASWVAVPVLVVVSSGSAIAGFAPGGIFGGDIFGGGDLFGDIGLGDIFGGDIFGDVFGGGVFGDIFGNQDCDPNIINIAPDYDCSPDSVPGNGGGNIGFGSIIGDIVNGNVGGKGGLFESIFEQVGGELGLPSEITDVILGRQGIEGIFGDLANDALRDIFGGAGGNTPGSDSDVLGKVGVPIYDDLADIFKQGRAAKAPGPLEGEPGERGLSIGSTGLATPNVNAAIPVPTQLMGVLTDAVTDRALSSEGQEMIAGRTAAAKTTTEASSKLAQSSDMAYKGQMTVAEALLPVIEEQTSTQDTLKKALSGQTILQAQATQFHQMATNQRAMSNQLDALSLDVAQENYLTGAVTAKSVSLLNEQLQKDAQSEIAARRSLEYESGYALRSYGGFAR